MPESLTEFVRGVLHWLGEAYAQVSDVIVSWVRGDDITVMVVLAGIALVALFVIVPNRRRY